MSTSNNPVHDLAIQIWNDYVTSSGRIEDWIKQTEDRIEALILQHETVARIDELEHCCNTCGFWHNKDTNKNDEYEGLVQTFEERINQLKKETDD